MTRKPARPFARSERYSIPAQPVTVRYVAPKPAPAREVVRARIIADDNRSAR